MGAILKFILAALLLFLVVTIAAFVYLPWWGALLVVAVMIIAIFGAIKYVMSNLGKILGKAMLKAFDVKSQVLRDAAVTVNHVEAVLAPAKDDSDDQTDDEDEPDDEDEDEEDEAEEEPAAKLPQAYYRIDVTITPRPAGAGQAMTHWDVDDLRVIEHDAPRPTLDLMAGDSNKFSEGYDLEKVQILEDGQYVDDEQGKHEGSKQIRATVGVPMHVRRLKFQYYTEQFGSIDLPQPLPQQSA